MTAPMTAPTAAPMNAREPKDIPVLFSGLMMQRLISGGKTQTRRLITSPLAKAEPGDRLWTREAFRAQSCFDHLAPRALRKGARISYEADPDQFGAADGKLRPAMFMPRWMSRATLVITDKRLENLQDISEADAAAEGVIPAPGETARAAFRRLWNHLHENGHAWDDNPRLAALTFEVHLVNIDQAPTHRRAS